MLNRSRLPFALIILDGLALNPNPKGNAVYHARKPSLDHLLHNFPNTTLTTFGPRVGLPQGQMGNSEVGHLNIGGGRIVRQELTRINEAVTTGALEKNETLNRLFRSSIENNSSLHLIGLVSTGGVHSEISHLEALIDAALKAHVLQIYVHVITDGRDRPPTSSLDEVLRLEKFIESANAKFEGSPRVKIATAIGRYFAMDRDSRWERTSKAYDLYSKAIGTHHKNVIDAIKSSHEQGVTDEFIEPIVISNENLTSPATVKDGDSLLFFNFRPDRMRQIVNAFLGDKIGFTSLPGAKVLNLAGITTLTTYDATLPVNILFPPQLVRNHLGDVIAANNLKQLRIAETEKYPHVTYFFNGGSEVPSDGEKRILIPSPRDIPTYDLKPEMSAVGVKDALVKALFTKEIDLAVVNFANCDMVGHTGVFDATVKAVETVDLCLTEILSTISKLNGTCFITADHGNADQMIDYETGGPHTFHTLHPVPFIIFGSEVNELKLRSGGALCDIAPTICKFLGLTQPEEMTGTPLF